MKKKKLHRDRSVESWKNPEIRNNREKALKEAHNRPEVIKRHSVATKEFLSDQKNLEERKIALKKAWGIPENREKLEKIIKIGLDAAMSPEGRKNHSKSQKNPVLRKKRSELAKLNIRKRLSNRIKYSGLNKLLEDSLNAAGLYPIPEYIIKYYAVDFCFPKEKIVVEADGDWWRANPEFLKEKNIYELHPIQKKMKRIDKAKNTFLKNRGWKVLRFWERDIKSNIEQCVKKIQEAVYES